MKTVSVASVLGSLVLAATVLVPAPTLGLETCRGLPATMTSDGADVNGTEGPDVIVAGGGAEVLARGGDDVICVLGSGDVHAGAGDDVVDASAGMDHRYTYTELGAGADTFIGGPARDQVYAADSGGIPSEADDTDVDVIDTADGPDHVTSGESGFANSDRITTGQGFDSVSLYALEPDGLLSLGDGRSSLTLFLQPGPSSWVVDATSRTVSRDGSDNVWQGEVSSLLVVTPSEGPRPSFTYRGTTGNDSITLSGYATGVLKTGPGNDFVTVTQQLEGGSVYSLGSGDDRLVLHWWDALSGDFPAREAHVDLARRTLVYGPPSTTPSRLTGVDVLAVAAKTLSLKGTDAADRIIVGGCEVDARGGAGPDRIERSHNGAGGCGPTRIAGGRGADRLFGSRRTDDVLIGGRGYDRANGDDGTDTCRAEITRNCEKV